MKLAISSSQKTAEGGTAPASPKKKASKRPVTVKKAITTLVILGLIGGSCFALYQLFFVEDSAVALTETITYGTLASVLDGTGTVTPTDSQTISFASNADILSVHVSAGDTVKAGDLLYIQDDSGVDDTIYDLEQSILEQEDILAGYYSQMEELQDRLSAVNVTAPFAGKILNVTVDERDNAQNNTVLATLVDSSTMTVTQYYSYAYENDITVGTTAQISIPDQMLLLTGEVTKVNKVDYVTPEGTHAFAVTISVPNPGSLTAGLSVTSYVIDQWGYTLYPVEQGKLSYAQETTITAGTSAEITGVYVESYQNVSTGQSLFSLDDDSLEGDMETLQSRIDSALSQIELLEERIVEAEESRSDYEVYSEIDGLVIKVNATTDRTPANGNPAVIIYNMDTMQISANIDELDIDSISMGMPVSITYSSGSNTKEYAGSITEISYEATNDSGVAYFPVTIEIDSQGGLSSGVNVGYYISIGEAADGYLVPIDALKSTSEGTAVFVQGESTRDALELADGIVPDGYYALPVEVAAVSSTYALVLEGLEEDMVVFTRYQQNAPSGGDTTSDSGEEEITMMRPGMEGMEGMTGMGGMSDRFENSGMSGNMSKPSGSTGRG